MWSLYKRAGVLSLLFIAGAAGSGPGVAAGSADGRDVRGAYELLNPVVGGGQVSGTFALWVDNDGAGEIDGATFLLENISPGDVLQPGVVYLTSSQVSLAVNAGTEIQGSVTVPEQEYDEWRQGAMPRVLMQYVTASGQSQLQAVEVSPKEDDNQLSNDAVDQLIDATAP